MGAVFQMDGYSAHRLTANVQLRVDRQPAADALLTVKVPVVLLRQADHACRRIGQREKTALPWKPFAFSSFTSSINSKPQA